MANDQVQGMLKGVEDLWVGFDELLNGLRTPADWARAHGNDWTFADVPYHMMYADRDLVAAALRRGRDVPDSEQKVQRTIGELNAWNAAKFAERPSGQMPEDSLEEWRAVREDVRREFRSLRDEDLMSKVVWFPLVGCGWVPAFVSAGFALAHTWSEFVQLRFHMGRNAPEPEPDTTHGAIGFLQGFLPPYLDKGAARGVSFTALMEYPGPGGGSWTLRVKDGSASVSEERDPDPDIVITQSPLTFELIRQGKLDPGTAMQNGDLTAAPLEQMATFGSLFPQPAVDKQIEPMGVGALG